LRNIWIILTYIYIVLKHFNRLASYLNNESKKHAIDYRK